MSIDNATPEEWDEAARSWREKLKTGTWATTLPAWNVLAEEPEDSTQTFGPISDHHRSFQQTAKAQAKVKENPNKRIPMARGLLDYFPDALKAVANCSLVANDQHNPGEELHWAKHKSTDHADALLRHLVDRGSLDDDGVRHSAKVAWRALAYLQIEIESEA